MTVGCMSDKVATEGLAEKYRSQLGNANMSYYPREF